MSRIAKMPIPIPTGVQVEVQKTTIKVSGPNGILLQPYKESDVAIKIDNNEINVSPLGSSSHCRAMSGTMRSLVSNMVHGDTNGFEKKLCLVGVGYKAQAKGSVLIHQKMFESRLFFVDKLIEMGAKIILCDPHRATVIGLEQKSKLKGTVMTSPDIRAGVALLIAALSAKGTSIIHNVEQIDRGYEDIDIRLNQLGAKISRIDS